MGNALLSVTNLSMLLSFGDILGMPNMDKCRRMSKFWVMTQLFLFPMSTATLEQWTSKQKKEWHENLAQW
jgi:hypothetical protein